MHLNTDVVTRDLSLVKAMPSIATSQAPTQTMHMAFRGASC